MRCLDLAPAARGLSVSSSLFPDLGPCLDGRSYSSASDPSSPLCQEDSTSFRRRLFSGRSLAMNSSSSLDILLTSYIDAENISNVSCESYEFVDFGVAGSLKGRRGAKRAKTISFISALRKHVRGGNFQIHLFHYSSNVSHISKRFITTGCSDQNSHYVIPCRTEP